MEYLQYINNSTRLESCIGSFKPYYKWNTFNTLAYIKPIHIVGISFKPYYKWNTFNTVVVDYCTTIKESVLNLIINGIPSILNNDLVAYNGNKGF